MEAERERASSMTLKSQVAHLLLDERSPTGRWVQAFIQLLIVLSVVGFTLETLPSLSNTWRSRLGLFEGFAIAVFTLEYVLRLWTAERRLGFIFSFHGLIDLLVILPFYLQLGLDLRSLRVFWLFRVFRLFKLARYGDSVRRMARAFHMVRVDLAVFGVGAFFVLYLSAVGIYFFERDAQPEAFASVVHAFWWALATLTTVGYGDVYPVTLGGRLFTFVTLMIGLGVFAVPTGLITMAMVSTRKADLEADDKDATVESAPRADGHRSDVRADD